jgi:uncharacterized protein YbjT (DUF2867 family)
MRIAVAGGTGVVGAHVVEAAWDAGHDVVVMSRSRGVDLVQGTGLDAALDGVEVVVDVATVASTKKSVIVEYFDTATRNLLDASKRAGVEHLVTLSIVGIDDVPLPYYAGKVRQEELVKAGPVPWTILRATQFHEFPLQLLGQIPGPFVPIPSMRSSTVAARDVGAHLVGLARASAAGMVPEMRGPGVDSMPKLARRVARAQGRRALIVPLRLPGALGRGMRGGALIPDGDVVRGTQTFDEWVTALASAPR